MPIVYRYRVLFYHENQKWLRKIVPLVDVPPLLLFLTDSNSEFEKQLDTGEVDVILTGFNTKHLLLKEDEIQSMAFKEVPIWDVIESHGLKCQIIVFCSQKEQALASGLVHDGKIADYCIVNPLLDRNRPYMSIIRALESTMLRDVVQKKVLKQGEHIPKYLSESIELLQTIRNSPDIPPPEPPEPRKAVVLPPLYSTVGFSEGEGKVSLDKKQEEPSVSASKAIEEDDFPTFPKPSSSFREREDIDDDDFPTFPKPSYQRESKPSPPSDSMFSSLKDRLGNSGISDSKPKSRKSFFSINEEEEKEEKKGDGRESLRMKKGKYNILLIENHQSTVQTIQQVLGRDGHRVLVAGGAEQGLYYMNHELFELLIIASDLPDCNGFDFLNIIRVRGPQADIPAIFLSDRVMEGHVIRSIKVGANYFMLKPINSVRLIEQISSILRKF